MSTSSNGNTWQINVSGWTLGTLKDYTRVAKAGNLNALNQWIIDHEVVSSWEYTGDPSDMNDWDNLPAVDGYNALQRVDQAVANIFRPKK